MDHYIQTIESLEKSENPIFASIWCKIRYELLNPIMDGDLKIIAEKYGENKKAREYYLKNENAEPNIHLDEIVEYIEETIGKVQNRVHYI